MGRCRYKNVTHCVGATKKHCVRATIKTLRGGYYKDTACGLTGSTGGKKACKPDIDAATNC